MPVYTTHNIDNLSSFAICTYSFEIVNSFIYLRAEVNPCAKIDSEIQNRVMSTNNRCFL